MKLDNLLFKKMIIVFWAVWWLIAVWTDIAGGLSHLGIIKALWAPDSNYPFLVSSLKMYSLKNYVPISFFVAIILGSLICSCTFVWSMISLNQPVHVWKSRAKVAFIISMTFWLAFFIADQLVMKFDLEENHMVQGGFQLLTFLALYILPDE